MLTTRGIVDPVQVAAISEWLGTPSSLHRVMAQLAEQELSIGDVVHMDEFTIDILVPLPDGLTLVFDTT